MRNRSAYWVLALLVQCLVLAGMASCGGDGSSGAGSSSSSASGGPTGKDGSVDGRRDHDRRRRHEQEAGCSSIGPTTAHFGSVLIGSASPVTTFTVTNTGGDVSGALDVSVKNATGDGAASFTLTNTCTAPLAAGATCTVGVSFVPATAVATTGTLTVSGTPGGSVTANVDSEGTAPGGLSVAADTNDLGRVVIGQTGITTATFTVTNTGDDPSGTITIQDAGSDPTNFKVTKDGCTGESLLPDATCTFTVSFVPLTRGTEVGDVRVTPTPGTTVKATVGGTALAPAHLSTLTPELTFGSVVVGKTSGTVKLFVANDGDVQSDALTQTLNGTDASISTRSRQLHCGGAKLRRRPPARSTSSSRRSRRPRSAGRRRSSRSTATMPAASRSRSAAPSSPQTSSASTPRRARSRRRSCRARAARKCSRSRMAARATAGRSRLAGADPTQFSIFAATDECGGVCPRGRHVHDLRRLCAFAPPGRVGAARSRALVRAPSRARSPAAASRRRSSRSPRPTKTSAA